MANAEMERAPIASIPGCGPYLMAEPPGPWLEPFRVARIAGREGGRYGHSVEREHVPLFRPLRLDDGRPAVQIWRGLRELARAAMEAQGLRVEATPPPLPHLWRATPYCPPDPGLIRFVEESATGVIRPDLAKGVDVVSLIAQVALAFPAARLLVIVPDCARVWRRALRRALRRCVGDVGVSTYRWPPPTPGLETAGADPRHAGFLSAERDLALGASAPATPQFERIRPRRRDRSLAPCIAPRANAEVTSACRTGAGKGNDRRRQGDGTSRC
jgi:hypothetical protein